MQCREREGTGEQGAHHTKQLPCGAGEEEADDEQDREQHDPLLGVRDDHAVQPAGQPLPGLDGPRLANQDQENGLKSILGVLGTTQQPAADAEYHRAVPSHQRLKSDAVAACGPVW